MGAFAINGLVKTITLAATMTGMYSQVNGGVCIMDAVLIFLLAGLLTSTTKKKKKADRVEIDVPVSEMSEGIVIKSFGAANAGVGTG